VRGVEFRHKFRINYGRILKPLRAATADYSTPPSIAMLSRPQTLRWNRSSQLLPHTVDSCAPRSPV
jgi:hypothetical protein